MKMDFDITKTVEKIVMQAEENLEEFIIETIHPYCEDVLQIKINKEELKQILLNSVQKQLPCEDCVSRKKLLSRIDAERKHLLDLKMDGAEHVVVHHARRIIEDMPSVTPTITDVENNYNIGYNCGYADAMSDIAEGSESK